MFDFSRLDSSRHMLEWLTSDPYQQIRHRVENILRGQVADSELLTFKVTSNPQWLTGGRRTENDPERMILTRTGVAFEFELTVRDPAGDVEQLQGVLTWVANGLDVPEQAKSRLWFDLGATLATHGSQGELTQRVHFSD